MLKDLSIRASPNCCWYLSAMCSSRKKVRAKITRIGELRIGNKMLAAAADA